MSDFILKGLLNDKFSRILNVSDIIGKYKGQPDYTIIFENIIQMYQSKEKFIKAHYFIWIVRNFNYL